MLYEEYRVIRSQTELTENGLVYRCELVGRNGHKIMFSLNLDKSGRDTAQYETCAKHINKGDILHCAFSYLWYQDYLHLCLAGFLKGKARRAYADVLGEEISAEEYFNPKRGYWAHLQTNGDWFYLPGPLLLDGQSYVHKNFASKPDPTFFSYEELRQYEASRETYKPVNALSQKIKSLLKNWVK